MDKAYKMELSLFNNSKNFDKPNRENNKKSNKQNFRSKTLNRTVFIIGNNSTTTKDSLT